jgi:hypothetical protein
MQRIYRALVALPVVPAANPSVCAPITIFFMLKSFVSGLAIATISIAVHADMAGVCRDYSSKIPGVSGALCESAGLQDMRGRSVKGRVIWGRDVGPTDAHVRVLVIGGIHGDESSSISLAYHWLGLAKAPPSDAPLSIHWRFIPSLNPDGLFSRPGRRTNASGVDLNRNFPTPNWARDAKVYWEQRTRHDPRRWPGNKPVSEPESRFMLEQMEAFKPDLIVSIHAPYGVLDFDGPSVPPSRLGRLYLDQVGIFPGSLGNYAGVHRRIPVVTIELPSASRLPQEGEVRQMWMDLMRWTQERLAPRVAAP